MHVLCDIMTILKNEHVPVVLFADQVVFMNLTIRCFILDRYFSIAGHIKSNKEPIVLL